MGWVWAILLGAAVARAEEAPSPGPFPAPPEPFPAPLLSPADLEPSEPLAEVTVRASSSAQRLQESARAVKVIETDEARRHTADLGAVLARTEGVAVQRGGGLGSPSRLSLHGLTDDQIRLFLDGVPLEFSGFGFGIATVPLNWIERIDVYRGVVPVAFGADALGGAIDLRTDQQPRGTTAALSYATGAFDTHQFSINARAVHEPTGFLTRAAAFYDSSDNDYVVDVNVPDELGQLEPVQVRRFHDGYTGGGGSLELGFVDRPWAQRLLLRLFATNFDKELQHNVNMTVPYGGVDYGQSARGGTLQYEQPRISGSDFSLALLAGYSHRDLDFRDTSRWVYDWFGNQIFERPENSGELSAYASDLTQWEDRGLGRATLGYRLTPQQALQLVVASDFTTRSGVERLRVNPERIDPLTTRREILQLVSGLEHRFTDLEDVVDNSLFAKDYYYHPSTDQVETFDNSLRHIESTTHHWGVGDALRVRVLDELMLKASYEYATRLPRPDEVFGDGALVTPNLELTPESSHNANLGAQAQHDFGGSFGRLELETSGFLRRTSHMIVQLPTSDRLHAIYQNVVDVRTLGVDGSLRWVTARQWLTLETNATWQDQRNASETGPFAPFEGQRLPNRPWLFANASATLRIPAFGAPSAELVFTWLSHYVREFQPGWSDNTATDYTGRIPTQFVHAASATYSVRGRTSIDLSLDVQNLTNERVYDVLGVQKPLRAAFFKLSTCWACPGTALGSSTEP
ncbi:MAG TPA: TonB-dependent receptor plug domain-containing protein [Polyangiaceae bacterium]|nr:TonB-dependent receptor plug domain-containing protein [Polyangiaceae bacterium]